jgi:hypothetical protein
VSKTWRPQSGQAQRRSTRLARKQALTGLLFISPWVVGFVLLKLLPVLISPNSRARQQKTLAKASRLRKDHIEHYCYGRIKRTKPACS